MAPAMFHSNNDFLNAIQTEPHERTLRLVYADWLDEHNDPRGELIRTEEEMRQVPVFADRFWELKPRRNELRTMAGAEWCALMKYGTECEPVFRHGIPDGWRERWRLIREFTERWHRVPMADVGDRQKDVAGMEARFGRTFPPSVREWIAFGLEWQWNQDYPGNLRCMYAQEVPGNAALSLWYSDEMEDGLLNDYHLAVLNSDLHESDPPVHCFKQGDGGDHNYGFVLDEREPRAESVTSLALDLVFTSAPPADDGFTIGSENLHDLRRDADLTFPHHIQHENSEWYEADDIALRIEPMKWAGNEIRLHVRIAQPATIDHIPGFLWQYARLGHYRRGIFNRYK